MDITKRYKKDLFLHAGYGLVSRSIRTGGFIRSGNALLYFAILSATLLFIVYRIWYLIGILFAKLC
jgi:hypothetical protein